MPGSEVANPFIFTGREVLRSGAKDTDTFWRRNPFALKPGKNMVLYAIDAQTGQRVWMDEARFHPPKDTQRESFGTSRDGLGSIERHRLAPDGGDRGAMLPPAPGEAARSLSMVRSLPDAQSVAIQQASTGQSQVLDLLKAELGERNREIGAMREEIRTLYTELAAANATRVHAQAELQKNLEIRAKEDEITRQVSGKLQREFEDDVKSEANRLAKRQTAQSGLGDSMGTLLSNPLVANAIGVILSKLVGNSDAPADGPAPIISQDPATAGRAYDVQQAHPQPQVQQQPQQPQVPTPTTPVYPVQGGSR